ncbi:MAG: glycosyltransferase [Desulfobacterales bacterium]|nr:glycosyltransferase [Desulfobacterales bacterium]
MLFTLSLITCLLMLLLYGELVVGTRLIGSLDNCQASSGTYQPLVTVIVPARNEAPSIEQGLRALCHQTYEKLEVIVVNDRSTDRTAEVIAKVRRHHPFLRVITIAALPEGWLGKTNAMHVGAREAQGEFLIFTDADVCLEKTTISRAVHVINEQQLDHLALVFQNSTKGRLLNALITDIGIGLMMLFKPWRVAVQKSRYFIGVGAFNMVRAATYHALGGHEKIRMQAVDDVFLGKMIKQHDFKQNCLLAYDYVSVPWYGSIDELISGLMKNVYAVFHYRLSWALGAIILVMLFFIAPLFFIFFTAGVTRYLFVLAIMIRISVSGAGMLKAGLPAGAIICLLITPLITIYIMLRAVWTTTRQQGITWRGNFYSLETLKQSEWLLSGIFTSGSKNNTL